MKLKFLPFLPLPFPSFFFFFARSLVDHLVPDEVALEVTNPLNSGGQGVGGNPEVTFRIRKLFLQVRHPRVMFHLGPEPSRVDFRPIDGERHGAKMDDLCGKSLFNF